jgi:hypothetical protein
MERRMDRSVVKLMSMDSPEFEENNMFIVDGTPQECWDIMWETNRQLRFLTGEEPARLRRDIVRKFYRNSAGELVEVRKGG